MNKKHLSGQTMYIFKVCCQGVIVVPIVYQCKHCGHIIGSLKQHAVSTSMLGWDYLSAQDRKHMIEYKDNGNVYIKTICENCEETLEENPHYHELDHFLQ